MIRIFLVAFLSMTGLLSFSQAYNADSSLRVLHEQKDSTLRSLKAKKDSAYQAGLHSDSVRINKEFKTKEDWEKLKGVAIYPVLRAGEFSGVIPVKDLTEIPDPKIDYKLLFELTVNNPDSTIKEVNEGLMEVARKINLHVASGIPLKKIFPVIVVHAGALFAITNNAFYKEKYKTDNPNIKLVGELVALGARVIACGQAMAFLDLKREALLPEIKVSLTAQTVLSHYQLKGYIKY